MRLERDIDDMLNAGKELIDGAVDSVQNAFDSLYDANIKDLFPCTGLKEDMDTMLLMAYVQLLTPLLSIVINCICSARNKDDNDQRAGGGVGLTGLVSMVSGSLYLAYYYKIYNCDNIFGECFNFSLFKWHVGMSMAVLSVGALVAALITLAFLGQMLCADCGSGERITSLCVYLFLMLNLILLFVFPLASVVLGWKYAFGDCQIIS